MRFRLSLKVSLQIWAEKALFEVTREQAITAEVEQGTGLNLLSIPEAPGKGRSGTINEGLYQR